MEDHQQRRKKSDKAKEKKGRVYNNKHVRMMEARNSNFFSPVINASQETTLLRR